MKKVYWRRARPEELDMEPDLDYHELAVRSMANGSTVAFVDEDGGLVGFGGILPIKKDSGEAWFSPHELFYNRPRAILAVKDALETMIVRTGIIRCQATVEAGIDERKRFAEWFGFQEEGLLRKYFEGRDHFMLARVK